MQPFNDTHPGYKKLLADTRKVARKNGIKIRFSKSEFVQSSDSDSKSIGHFDSDNLEIVCSNYNNFDIFVRNFIHESCHMDQFLNDKFLWDKCEPGYNIFFQWLEDKKIFKREVLEEAVQDIIRIEKDCEHRTIEKIKKYNLPIDIKDYTKRANTYLYGYLFFLEKKKWIPGIYNNPDALKVASTKFAKSYTKIPNKLYAVFKRYFKNNKTV